LKPVHASVHAQRGVSLFNLNKAKNNIREFPAFFRKMPEKVEKNG
jgi:hypothetical protein